MDLRFDTIVTVDWSGGAEKSRTPSKDAIWWCVARDGVVEPPRYFRSRQQVEPALCTLIETERSAGRRLFVGFDFAFGYPAGFGQALTGSEDPLAVWSWLNDRIEDSPQANNRFAVASDINRQFDAPLFWGCPTAQQTPHLSMRKRDPAHLPFAERRAVETCAPGAFAVWQLAYAGAVGSQVLMGLPVLHRLKAQFPDQISVWPFEPLAAPVAFVEVWPSLYAEDITAQRHLHDVKDAVQMQVLTSKIAAMSRSELALALDTPATQEGWIFGVSP